jgi:hypothetical protein
MIIELDESIMNIKELNTNQDQDIIKSLDMLAHIRQYGNHYVLAKVHILEHIVKLIEPFNKDSTKNIFKHIIHNDFVQKYHQLLNQVKYKVLISTNKTSFEIEESNGIKIYHIPLAEFHKLFELEKTSFYSENVKDCIFYEHITNWFLGLEKTDIHLNYNAVNGKEPHDIEYILSIEPKKFCLIILDSDKKCPNSKCGNTLKDAKKTYEEFKNDAVSELFYFENIHEKENLIPPTLYEELFYDEFYSKNDYKVHFNNLMKLTLVENEYHDHHEKLQYFDFKKGVDLGKNIINNIKSYFKPLLDNLNTKKIGSILDDKNKMNNKLNNKLKNYFESHSKEEILNELPDYIKKSWELLSTTVFSWCCSPGRIQ